MRFPVRSTAGVEIVTEMYYNMTRARQRSKEQRDVPRVNDKQNTEEGS